MKRSVPISVVAAAVLVAFAVGAGLAWSLSKENLDHDLLGLTLAHELEVTGLCANALTLAEIPQSNKLSVLLDTRLASAVRRSSLLLEEGARFNSIATPNLRDSARRAADYFERKSDVGKQQEAERLFANLAAEK